MLLPEVDFNVTCVEQHSRACSATWRVGGVSASRMRT